MFTFPPYPPKDYVLRDVPKIQRSSPQFTPEAGPRVTQTTLGRFCYPIEYGQGETPKKIEVQTCSPYILEKWTNDDRALWVDKPGKDDYFLHDIFKRYNVKGENYNPVHRHMEKVFNRSYKYELVCLEERRLQKLRDKCEREQSIWEHNFKTVEKKEHAENHPPMEVLKCKAQPPFWWRQSGAREGDALINSHPGLEVAAKPARGRWAKEPCLTAVVVDDPCRRKYDMHSYEFARLCFALYTGSFSRKSIDGVGQPFKNEACNFYYTNYPPPDIKLRPKKFS